MLIYLYVIQHLAAILLLSRATASRVFFGCLSILVFIYIQITKLDTYDILSYTGAVSYAHVFEPGYAVIIQTLSIFIADPREVITYYQFFLGAAIIYLAAFFKENTLIILGIILGSVMTFLAINNNLRQGTSSIFLLYSIIIISREKYLLSFVLIIAAQLFHSSAILFAAVIVFFYIIARLFFLRIPMFFRFFVALLIVAFMALFIYLAPQFTGYENYLDKSFPGRTSLLVKSILLILIFLASEALMRYKSISFEIDFVRVLRAAFVLFAFVLSFLGGFEEIGARILYFYYAVELLLMLQLVSVSRYQPVVIIFVGYGFAFNVYKILGGL